MSVYNSITKNKKNIVIAITLFLLPAKSVLAHCPLCTAGAGVLAVGAAAIGVSNTIIGGFIGAFAIAMGLWISTYIKKQIIPKQAELLAISSYILTVIPLYPVLKQYGSLYLPWIGEYGLTVPINLFLLGSVLGAIIMFISPWVSKKIALARGGKIIPFQGITITFILIITISLMIDLII